MARIGIQNLSRPERVQTFTWFNSREATVFDLINRPEGLQSALRGGRASSAGIT